MQKTQKLFAEDENVEMAEIHEINGALVSIVPLEKKPEIAQRIAIFQAHFALSETMTASVFSLLLDIPEPDVVARLARINGYGHRLNEIEKEALSSTSEHKDFVLEFVSEMRWVTTERNGYAHAQFAVGKDSGKLYRGIWINDKRETIWDIVTIEKLDADILRAKKHAGRAWDYMRRISKKLKSFN